MVARSAWLVALLSAFLLTGSADVARAEPLTVRGVAPAVSEAEAVTVAKAAAVEALLPALRARVKAVASTGRHRPAAPSEDMLRTLLAGELASGDRVTTSRIERDSRPYGDIYYATLAINPSGRWLDELARKALSAAGVQRHRKVAAVAVTVALVGLLLVFYTVANYLTRGYYEWPLVGATAALGAVGLGVVAAAYHLVPWTSIRGPW